MKKLLALSLCFSLLAPLPIVWAETADEQTDETMMEEETEDPEVEKTPEQICREQMSAKEGQMSHGALLYLLRRCVRAVNLDKEKAKKLLQELAQKKKDAEGLKAHSEKFRKAGSRRLIQQGTRKDRFKKLKETLKAYRRVRPRERRELLIGTGSLRTNMPKTKRGIRGYPNAGTGSSVQSSSSSSSSSSSASP